MSTESVLVLKIDGHCIWKIPLLCFDVCRILRNYTSLEKVQKKYNFPAKKLKRAIISGLNAIESDHQSPKRVRSQQKEENWVSCNLDDSSIKLTLKKRNNSPEKVSTNLRTQRRKTQSSRNCPSPDPASDTVSNISTDDDSEYCPKSTSSDDDTEIGSKFSSEEENDAPRERTPKGE